MPAAHRLARRGRACTQQVLDCDGPRRRRSITRTAGASACRSCRSAALRAWGWARSGGYSRSASSPDRRDLDHAFPSCRVRGLTYAVGVQVLIVDGANVMGSRPDGWWRDRAGAARRLHEQLLAAVLPYDEVVLILEGAARRGIPAGQDGRVRTVHAPGSGDDAIVQAVMAQVDVDDGRGITVVTADRVLRDRVAAAGARSVSPSSLLDQL